MKRSRLHRKTQTCPVQGASCSTAYNRRRCRCEACAAWQRDRHRRRYAADPERERGRSREHQRRERCKNPEKAREKSRREYAANPQRARERARRYRERNANKVRARKREYSRRLQAALVAFLGGKCERCASTRKLDAHHVNGDGVEHRKRAGGRRGSHLEILSGAYPREAIELLCRSCHLKADRRPVRP